MRAASELVLHVQVPNTGGRQVARALRTLRPGLRDRGVAVVGAGAAERRDGPSAYADRLRRRAAAERRRTGTRPGSEQTVLVCDHSLLGPPVSAGDERWYPRALTFLEPLVAALGARRTTVLLVVRRQDRWLERQHLEEVLHGSTAELADWMAALPSPAPDYHELASRIEGAGADRLEVLPYETVAGASAGLTRQVLASVGVEPDLLGGAAEQEPVDAVCTGRGLAVARALNSEAETVDEEGLVRRFVLRTFPTGPDDLQVLDPDQRAAVLGSCSDANRRLFARYLPAADPAAYAEDDATQRLATRPGGRVPVGPARVGPTARAFRLWDGRRGARGGGRQASG